MAGRGLTWDGGDSVPTTTAASHGSQGEREVLEEGGDRETAGRWDDEGRETAGRRNNEWRERNDEGRGTMWDSGEGSNEGRRGGEQ
jgi:hypothetical protein